MSKGIAKVAIMFDDALTTQYTQGFDYLSSNNKAATIYVPTAYVGTEGYLTYEQLQEMDADGWSIGNHTQNHVDLTTLTQAEAETELSDAETDLTNNSLSDAANHVAYPFGAVDSTVLSAMQNSGMLTGTKGNAEYINVPVSDWHNLTRRQFDNFEDTRDWIKIADKNQVCSVFFHALTGSALSGFKSLVDWLKNNSYEFITIEDLYGL